MACGILVPWPGIETVPAAVEALCLNHWTAREIPRQFFILMLRKKGKRFFLLFVFFCQRGRTFSFCSGACKRFRHLQWEASRLRPAVTGEHGQHCPEAELISIHPSPEGQNKIAMKDAYLRPLCWHPTQLPKWLAMHVELTSGFPWQSRD